MPRVSMKCILGYTPPNLHRPVVASIPRSQYAHKFHFFFNVHVFVISFSLLHIALHAFVLLWWRQHGIIKGIFSLKSWSQYFLMGNSVWFLCLGFYLQMQRISNPLLHRRVVRIHTYKWMNLLNSLNLVKFSWIYWTLTMMYMKKENNSLSIFRD